ncbi:MAG TPA: hypothetical protein VGF94_04105 [Kofleriaceae bacterium]|jgi:hypothetical protein
MRIVALALAVLAGAAHADPPPPASGAVALLPLDADHSLEIYGQPVASEVARELVAGGVAVVVVGPKMEVPEGARLVVDGTIKLGKGDQVTLAVRIRDRTTGATLDKLDTSATLATIDRAASELAARVLPSVKARLAPPADTDSRHPPDPRRISPPAPVVAHVLATSVDGDPASPLRQGFATAFAAWTAHHAHWQVAGGGPASDGSIAISVLAYAVTPGAVPTARARVRVKIGHDFDRIVVTDTVVGDRGIADDKLAARTARAVLDIVEPHMRHALAAWR